MIAMAFVGALALLMPVVASAEESGAARAMRYTPVRRTLWRRGRELRTRLLDPMRMRDLAETGYSLPLDARMLATGEREGFRLDTLELRATPGRVFQAMLAFRRKPAGRCPRSLPFTGTAATA